MSQIAIVAGGLLVGCAAAVALVLSGASDTRPSSPRTSPDGAEVGGADIGGELREPATRRRVVPDAAGSGYAGTAEQRGGDAYVGPRSTPWGRTRRSDWRDGYFPGGNGVEALAALLPRQREYPELLRLLHRLGGPFETDPPHDPDGALVTRYRTQPERMARLLGEALDETKNGAVRQSLIFHMALALPREHVAPTLLRLAASADAADAEDALCALAFTGDEASLAWFDGLAPDPSAVVREPVVYTAHSAARLFTDGRRDALRAYRCIEALDGSPYFHIHGLWLAGVHEPFPWATDVERPPELQARALTAWLRRYPGHAGSDDMSYRMARLCLADGRDREALRWASRGMAEPDGDLLASCVALTTAILEFAPPGSAVLEQVVDPAAPRRNRDLLHYVRLRRRARDVGFRAALTDLEALATRAPELLLARAWRERWSAPVPRALESGLAPLPPDDPLRRVEESREGPDPETRHWDQWRRRPIAFPPEDVGLLRLDPLRRQIRSWETMAALRKRWTTAAGDEAGDLLYKQAALHYHERDVLFPAYAFHRIGRSGCPESFTLGRGRDPDLDVAWTRGVLSWDRAIALFEELLLRDPSHPLCDEALYSMALAHVKAADDRTVRRWSVADVEQPRHVHEAIAAFERLVVEHPDSPMRPESEAAIRYWRDRHGKSGRRVDRCDHCR